MITENKYKLDYLLEYIINLLTLLRIIFFGCKKNNKRIISKIVPIPNSDKEIRYYDDFEEYENIPLNCSLSSKNVHSKKII